MTHLSLVTMEEQKTPGQLAYECYASRFPRYSDGARRCAWRDLPEYARSTWEGKPAGGLLDRLCA